MKVIYFTPRDRTIQKDFPGKDSTDIFQGTKEFVIQSTDGGGDIACDRYILVNALSLA